ncbi:MAG: ATP-binding protein [Rhodobacteraceae bacterium]|jgi:serine/threonine-protein kinase RsbW|nr:ATP-binding protein [Paracoccaceae bacterium]
MAIRGALTSLRAALAPLDMAADDLDSVELVVAEVLNNIVEHAYAGTQGGMILVTAWTLADDLAFRIEDEGDPMPGGVLPPGKTPRLDAAVEDLPEGGFGWFLIHTLTRDLTYDRVGPRNRLTFRMATGAPPTR